MGITERKEREKAEMRRTILDAAITLFVEEGYENVSMRKIADKIEYSPASIYTYFEDKSAILVELLTEGFDILFQKQLAVQGIEDSADRLIAHGKNYLEFAFEFPHFYDIMFIMRESAVKTAFHNNWDCGHRSFGVLLKNIAECQADGYFKNADVNQIAFFVWSTVHGMASLFIRKRTILIEKNIYDFDNFIDESVKILNNIIR